MKEETKISTQMLSRMIEIFICFFCFYLSNEIAFLKFIIFYDVFRFLPYFTGNKFIYSKVTYIN
jgi:hypothetical protein